jgi:hypothetical protein
MDEGLELPEGVWVEYCDDWWVSCGFNIFFGEKKDI